VNQDLDAPVLYVGKCVWCEQFALVATRSPFGPLCARCAGAGGDDDGGDEPDEPTPLHTPDLGGES